MDNGVNWLPFAIIFFILYCSALADRDSGLASYAKSNVESKLRRKNKLAEKNQVTLSMDEQNVADSLLNHVAFLDVERSLKLVVDKPVSKDEAEKIGYVAFINTAKEQKNLMSVLVLDKDGETLATLYRDDLPTEYRFTKSSYWS